jgi:HEAT repeat protein
MVILLLVMALVQQDDAAATQAITTFDATFSKTKDSNARVAEVSTLAKTPHEKVANKLGTLLTNEDKAVRTAAAVGLGSFTSAAPEVKKSASKALISGLSAGANLREVEVRVAILTALGVLQEESSGTALKTHFDDKDAKIAGAAITAAGQLKTKTMVEPLIEQLKDSEKNAKLPAPAPSTGGKKNFPKGGGGGATTDPEQAKHDRASALIPVAQAALGGLTGQSHANGDEWEKWWIKNKSTFTVPK